MPDEPSVLSRNATVCNLPQVQLAGSPNARRSSAATPSMALPASSAGDRGAAPSVVSVHHALAGLPRTSMSASHAIVEPTHSRASAGPSSSSKIARWSASSTGMYAAQPSESTGHVRSQVRIRVHSSLPSSVVTLGPRAARSRSTRSARRTAVSICIRRKSSVVNFEGAASRSSRIRAAR